jgi:CheY-like chemotaxis protein
LIINFADFENILGTSDVIIMDIVLPKLNGVEATGRIKEKFPNM